MKEENEENMENMEYMEKVSFSDIRKVFLSPEQKEDPKDEISQYTDISPEVIKILIETLKEVDNIVKPTDEGVSRKGKWMKETEKQDKENLKENLTKVEIDERTGEVLKKKSRKAIPVREEDEELSK